jgi:N-6 DNA Methylase
LPRSAHEAQDVVAALNGLLARAVERSGDYEPLLMPEARDWATEIVFQPEGAVDAWRGLLRHLESVDFSKVSSDVVGRIFQKLIGPEERHRYGQHFTGDDVVDLINGFCIRDAGDAVLDPACGSGSFLVRAYYRKRHLDQSRSHLANLADLFGCDIALYPAHLATLNLAAREITDEANYPRIARRNFFDVARRKPFCHIPGNSGDQAPIYLPELSAVVGNPPYVRQEKIMARDKARFGALATRAWPDLRLSGRSDLHCYFWPAATHLLKSDGYFGFLTSSSWLDVEYGFALQGWLLRHFRILAVMESAVEPWFEDARVKTCVTILQRCEDDSARMRNRVRFVRFAKRLAEIISVPPSPDEGARQAAVDELRERVLGAQSDRDYGDLRVIVRTQDELWRDGLRAGAILRGAQIDDGMDEDEAGEIAGGGVRPAAEGTSGIFGGDRGAYGGGKWGRYVRAPDFHFEIMKRFGHKFVALGEIADIRFGVKTGCDAFFLPKDITAMMLTAHPNDRDFRRAAAGAPRADVESGRLRIIEAGDGSVHPIEGEYIKPEVHSLMKLDRPVVRATDLDRVVLLVSEPIGELKREAPWVHRYLRYGMTATFPSGKSKPVPVPKRSTCAARDPWYDLTGLVRPGIAFWPMAQQYRHIVAANPERLVCNHNLFDLSASGLSALESGSLVAILNSTLIGFFKTFYGRFAGTEGNLKTEVVDVNLLEVPDPRGVAATVGRRLTDALAQISTRPVGRLIEEQLMDCHVRERAMRIAGGPLALSAELGEPDRRILDEAVFELLGVLDPRERAALVDRLHYATARHFRDIRVVEIEKMEQRSKSDTRRFNISDLAADIWDAAGLEDTTPLADWITEQPESDLLVLIPDDLPAIVKDSPLFGQNSVYFGKTGKTQIECASRGQAELVARLANLGIKGQTKTPAESDQCLNLLTRVNTRIEKAQRRFKDLAESRTSDERIQSQLEELLLAWFIIGRESHPAPRGKGRRPHAGYE